MSVFDSKNRTFRHRNEINVALRLKGADEDLAVTIFASPGERAQDLLNDERTFIPVRTGTGETMLIAKTQIEYVLERRAEETPRRAREPLNDGFDQDAIKQAISASSGDPYSLLRVSPDAGADEIRAAYKARIKAVHPDTLASLGLDEEITRAAILTTQKVNLAYQKIMRERGASTSRII